MKVQIKRIGQLPFTQNEEKKKRLSRAEDL